ncbi:MAG TPA: M3 family metallopeptidase [Roseiarcus sp.]|nr:M3 family metallopeptidase [Roseiarcus sp.]
MTDNQPGNPLLEPWTGPLEAPPFAALSASHFRPAFDAALDEARAEIAAIAANREPATFENTIKALERSGRRLSKVSSVFFNLVSADANDEMQAIEREVAPRLARQRDEVFLNRALYDRVAALQAARASLGLGDEQARVLERYQVLFSRAGAGLADDVKERLAAINERLATLGAKFGQNMLADEKSWRLVLEAPEDLEGLPDWLVASAARAAADRGLPGKHVITLARSSVEPFLQFSARRDLREKAFAGWAVRGENPGPTDNRAIIGEIVKLRAERARLLGFDSFAEFRLADTMAKTPEAARALLETVWTPALAHAAEEEAALQAIVAEEDGNFRIAPWDWRYYAEKRRKRLFDLDEDTIKPYLTLDRMIEAAFFVAGRLFGLSFVERFDIPLYHPDVRSWTALSAEGAPVALFLGDYFARPSKRSGAWSSGFRKQEKLDGAILPIVVNVLNLAKPPDGEPPLLGFDEARTLFHEFGHALHAMLSSVTYPLISGTSVATDFVEFPSQVYERWLERPEILRRFALHRETGEPMPERLLDKVMAAQKFNRGFATVECAASAFVDLDLHAEREPENVDVVAFEKQELDRLKMPEAIAMRHRTPHFQHIFSGGGYAAAYYSYLWSEVLDADGFEAFEETGDIFDPALAAKLLKSVYSAGNLCDPETAYEKFRGRPPEPGALMRKRGFARSFMRFSPEDEDEDEASSS